METPKEQGFRAPAEWEPQSRCWMAWPARKAVWGEKLAAAREGYAAVARSIALYQPVIMVAKPENAAEASLQCGKGVSVLSMPIDDSWFRDNGPSFLVDDGGALAGVTWGWNAWGEQYTDYANDAALAERILAHLDIPRFVGPMILEGGAVHVDGEGTLLATEQCLLNPNRNPSLAREDIEKNLGDFLGIEKVIWLGRGLVDDDTDGHVDNLACFVRPGVVMALTTRNKDDANYGALADNLERLREARDARGRELAIIEIEQPAPQYADERRLPLSYINFCIVNRAVIVPEFEDSRDARARAAIAEAFPDRQIVPAFATDICRGGGGIHCITLQQPAGAAAGKAG